MKRRLQNTSTSLAFAIAAFTLSAAGAQAFSSQAFLTKAGLSDDQVVAIQEARELRHMGDLDAARAVLIEAGIDLELLAELRHQHQVEQVAVRHWLQDQIDEKLTPEQQDALMVARAANDKATVEAILDEVGISQFGG